MAYNKNMTNIYLQKQRFTVTGAGGIAVEFEIDEDQITIFNERGKTDFCFKNSNTVEVLDYWQEIFKCMGLVVQFAKQQLDKPRTVKLLCTNPKGTGRKAVTREVRSRKAKGK